MKKYFQVLSILLSICSLVFMVISKHKMFGAAVMVPKVQEAKPKINDPKTILVTEKLQVVALQHQANGKSGVEIEESKSEQACSSQAASVYLHGRPAHYSPMTSSRLIKLIYAYGKVQKSIAAERRKFFTTTILVKALKLFEKFFAVRHPRVWKVIEVAAHTVAPKWASQRGSSSDYQDTVIKLYFYFYHRVFAEGESEELVALHIARFITIELDHDLSKILFAYAMKEDADAPKGVREVPCLFVRDNASVKIVHDIYYYANTVAQKIHLASLHLKQDDMDEASFSSDVSPLTSVGGAVDERDLAHELQDAVDIFDASLEVEKELAAVVEKVEPESGCGCIIARK